ncbi:HNH endonuclease [Cohnella lupini]|uniref:HNH endonuclease n=1 Tax=Cohnella lupini TaxID=1294267 RepID=UPI000E2456F5
MIELAPIDGIVYVRSPTKSSTKWFAQIDVALASLLVREQAAVVKSPTVIVRLYDARTFRQFVLERDGYTCVYCGEVGGNLTLDHVVPRSKGGKSTPLNVVAACLRCNQSKDALDLDDFICLLPRGRSIPI